MALNFVRRTQPHLETHEFLSSLQTNARWRCSGGAWKHEAGERRVVFIENTARRYRRGGRSEVTVTSGLHTQKD